MTLLTLIKTFNFVYALLSPPPFVPLRGTALPAAHRGRLGRASINSFNF